MPQVLEELGPHGLGNGIPAAEERAEPRNHVLGRELVVLGREHEDPEAPHDDVPVAVRSVPAVPALEDLQLAHRSSPGPLEPQTQHVVREVHRDPPLGGGGDLLSVLLQGAQHRPDPPDFPQEDTEDVPLFEALGDRPDHRRQWVHDDACLGAIPLLDKRGQLVPDEFGEPAAGGIDEQQQVLPDVLMDALPAEVLRLADNLLPVLVEGDEDAGGPFLKSPPEELEREGRLPHAGGPGDHGAAAEVEPAVDERVEAEDAGPQLLHVRPPPALPLQMALGGVSNLRRLTPPPGPAGGTPPERRGTARSGPRAPAIPPARAGRRAGPAACSAADRALHPSRR